MPVDDDTNTQGTTPARSAYGLPELRTAIRAGAKGISKLMERAGLLEACHNLAPTGFGVYDVVTATPPRSRKARQPDAAGDTSAEQLSSELLLQRTIDDCLAHFHRGAFALGKPGLLGFSQQLFGHRAWSAHNSGNLAAHSVWVCDQFIGAECLSEVVEPFASEGCLELKNDRPVSKLEKNVLGCLREAATGSIDGAKAHLDIVGMFLEEEILFLEGLKQCGLAIYAAAESA